MNNISKPRAYAVKHPDASIRKESQSGGIFTALSDHILSEGGVVYGCVMSEPYKAVHQRAETAEQRDRMRGSKYIESKLGDTFKNVKADLLDGRKVLFSGTPCQVDGLKCFLGKPYENLYLVDIICHGVPSPDVWKKYLEWQESRHGKCVGVDFRNKKQFGWAEHIESMHFLKNGKKKRIDSRVFTNIFYAHIMLRPSCYECKYKTAFHPGDITIADFWAIREAFPAFDDNKGVSLVLMNSEKGQKLFDSVSDKVICSETEYKKSTRPTMFNPPKRPDSRDKFWDDFKQKDFGYIAERYGGHGTKMALKIKMRRIINRKVK